jgi:hypothetical protein
MEHMNIEVETTCPACGEVFDCEFDPEQDVNDIDCPGCNAELVIDAYDPKRGALVLAEAEDDEVDDVVIDAEFTDAEEEGPEDRETED